MNDHNLLIEDLEEPETFPNGTEPIQFHFTAVDINRYILSLSIGDYHYTTDLTFTNYHDAEDAASLCNNCFDPTSAKYLPLVFDVRNDLDQATDTHTCTLIIHTEQGIIDTSLIAYPQCINPESLSQNLNQQSLLDKTTQDEIASSTNTLFKDKLGVEYNYTVPDTQH